MSVVVLIVIVLLVLLCPSVNRALTSAYQLQGINNAQELQKAWQQAAFDGETNGSTEIGWPGDISPPPTDMVSACQLLSRLGYLPSMKVLFKTGISADKDLNGYTEKNCAFGMALLTSDSRDSLPFIWTKNFNPLTKTLEPATKPSTNNDFVVVRKGGDAGRYQPIDVDKKDPNGKFAYIWGDDLAAESPPIKTFQPPK